jgi:hypothetical protein
MRYLRFNFIAPFLLLVLVILAVGCRSRMSSDEIWRSDEKMFQADLDVRYPLNTLKSEILANPKQQIDVWEKAARPNGGWQTMKDDSHGVAEMANRFEHQTGKITFSCLMLNVSSEAKRGGGSFDYLFFDSNERLIGSHRLWAEWML